MKYQIILCVLLLLILTACSDFTAPERFKTDQYTLSAILVAGGTISLENPVIVGKSVDLSDLNSPDMFIKNADVNIFVSYQGAEITSFGLFPYNIVLPNTTDSVTLYVDPMNHVIQPDHTYRIEVVIPGYEKTISAETTVPKLATLITDFHHLNVPGYGYTMTYSDSLPVIPFERIDLDYPVALKVDGVQAVNTLVELFCLEEFSTDLEFTTQFLGQIHPPASMESSYYDTSGETIRRINFMARLVSELFDDGFYYLLLEDYKHGFIFYGRYMVTAFTVDDNYYYYKFMAEGYFHGGVVNALGCFGSKSGGTMYTKIVGNEK
jgi:hypothetical protein